MTRLEQEQGGADRTGALLAEYGEVNENFRLLTDIRFKLLAFLPLLAAAGLAAAGVGGSRGAGLGLEAGVFLFGLVATCALASYNARNDQIYVRLVTRAAEIERELGLPDGSFARRPNAWLDVSLGPARWHVGHVSSVSAMYGSAVVIWLTGLLAAVAHIAWGSGAMPWWIYGAAGAVSLAGVFRATVAMRRQRETREAAIAEAGREAIGMAPPFRAARSEPECRAVPDYGRFVDVCTDLFGREHNRKWAKAEIERRIAYFAELDDEERRRYGLDDSSREDIVYIATLADLPLGMLTAAPRRR